MWPEVMKVPRSRPRVAERWSGPAGQSNSENELSWKEPFSQRFHRLSKHALDEIIETLLALPVEHGVATKWTLTDGQMQRLCSAARCGFLAVVGTYTPVGEFYAKVDYVPCAETTL